MRWEGREQSGNVEDRRGGGGGGRMALGGGLGTLVLLLIVWMLGGDPMQLLQQTGGGPGVEAPSSPEEEKTMAYVKTVLKDTETIWHDEFARMGKTYEEPKLVVFTSQVQSGCGFAGAQMGPFYCPVDRTVYIDLSFYQELQSRFGAPGDFAQAYVVAHEVGHHVQTLLGISERTMAARQSASEAQANALSVRQELQADCFAGIWAHNADRSRQLLEAGDIEEGLNAAAAIGDDRLQKQSRGSVSPESFTHGSSEQRVRWVKRGFEAGTMEACDTFATRSL